MPPPLPVAEALLRARPRPAHALHAVRHAVSCCAAHIHMVNAKAAIQLLRSALQRLRVRQSGTAVGPGDGQVLQSLHVPSCHQAHRMQKLLPCAQPSFVLFIQAKPATYFDRKVSSELAVGQTATASWSRRPLSARRASAEGSQGSWGAGQLVKRGVELVGACRAYQHRWPAMFASGHQSTT